MHEREYEIIDYLREENRVLRDQLGERRLRFNDDQRILFGQVATSYCNLRHGLAIVPRAERGVDLGPRM